MMTTGDGSTRQHILDAVIAIIDSEGEGQVRLTEVARRCGVSTPLMYHYFENRNHLVASAMLERYTRVVVQDTTFVLQRAEAATTSRDVVEASMDLGDEVRKASRRQLRWEYLEARSMAAYDSAIMEVATASEAEISTALEGLSTLLSTRGWLRPEIDPRAYGDFWRSIAYGQILQEVEGTEGNSAEEWGDAVSRLFYAFFQLDPDSTRAHLPNVFDDQRVMPPRSPSDSGGEGSRPSRKHSAGQRKILDATIAEIAEHGVVNLRTKAVAERAGVSVALLFHHFASREGLIGAAVAERFGQFANNAVRRLHDLLLSAVDSEGVIDGCIDVAVYTLTAKQMASGRQEWLEAVVVSRNNEAARSALAEAQRDLGEHLTQFFSRLHAENILEPLVSPRVMSDMWKALVFGQVLGDITPDLRPTAEQWRTTLKVAFTSLLRPVAALQD